MYLLTSFWSHLQPFQSGAWSSERCKLVHQCENTKCIENRKMYCGHGPEAEWRTVSQDAIQSTPGLQI